MLNFNCYDATCIRNKNNCLYPSMVTVVDRDSLTEIVQIIGRATRDSLIVTIKRMRNYPT